MPLDSIRAVDARAIKTFLAPPTLRPIEVRSLGAGGGDSILLRPAEHLVAAPVLVKYERVRSAADRVHVGRMPAFDRNGTARLNRFVFRRTPAPSSALPQPAASAGDASVADR